jgi:hypothetical protein
VAFFEHQAANENPQSFIQKQPRVGHTHPAAGSRILQEAVAAAIA